MRQFEFAPSGNGRGREVLGEIFLVHGERRGCPDHQPGETTKVEVGARTPTEAHAQRSGPGVLQVSELREGTWFAQVRTCFEASFILLGTFQS